MSATTKVVPDEIPKLHSYGIDIKDTLGAGTFGTVYSAEYQDEMVAVKYMKGLNLGDLNEMDVQSRIQNDYLSYTLGVLLPYSSKLGGTAIIMPLAIKTSRMIIIGEYTFCERVSYLRKVIEAIHCLHSKGILHLDIKIDNILNQRVTRTVDEKEHSLYEPVVSDFGLCRSIKSVVDGKYIPRTLGTRSWSAPEHFKYYYKNEPLEDVKTRISKRQKLNKEELSVAVSTDTVSISREDTIKMRTYRGSSDMWSLAIFAYRILTGLRTYPRYVALGGQQDRDIYDTLVDFFGTDTGREQLLWEDISRSKRIPEDKRDLVFELLYPMFSWDPAQRPSAYEVLKFPIFSDIITPISMCYETEKVWPPLDLKGMDPTDLQNHYTATKNIVKSIVIWLSNSNMKGLDMGVMYHAIDIAYLYALKVETSLLEANKDLLTITCIFIALNYGGFVPSHKKMYDKLPRNIPVYDIGDIYEQQEKIISALSLVIYRRFLFDSVRERSDIVSHYRNIIFSPAVYYSTTPQPVDPTTFSNPEIANFTVGDISFR